MSVCSLVCGQDADVDAPEVFVPPRLGHPHELGVAPRDGVRHDGLLLQGIDDALQELPARGSLVLGRVVPVVMNKK